MAQPESGQNEQKSGETLPWGYIVKFVILGIPVLAGMCFLMAFLAAPLAKDMEVKDGVLVDGDGKPVLISSQDLYVAEDGNIMKRCASGATCPQVKVKSSEFAVTGDGVLVSGALKTIATRQHTQQHNVSSTVPDHILKEMKQISLVGDDGTSSLQLQVFGMMRAVIPGSRCGTVVNFFTQMGEVGLDDTMITVDAQLAQALTRYGFKLSHSGVSSEGRQLVEATKATGFFSIFEEYNRTCAASQPPRFFVKPCFRYDRRVHPCYGSLCKSAASSKGVQLMKPGYDEKEHAVISYVEAWRSETRKAELSYLPNHPGQVMVNIMDYTTGKQHAFQQGVDGSALYCKGPNSFNVTTEQEKALDPATDYTHVYMDTVNDLRRFLLIPKDRDGNPFPVEYWDNATTQMPKKITLLGARDAEMDTETFDIIVETPMSAADVDAKINQLLSTLCTGNINLTTHASWTLANTPEIEPEDVYLETEKMTRYYADVLEHLDNSLTSQGNYLSQNVVTAGRDPYWKLFVHDVEHLSSVYWYDKSWHPDNGTSARRLVSSKDVDSGEEDARTFSNRSLLTTEIGWKFEFKFPLVPYEIEVSIGEDWVSRTACWAVKATKIAPSGIWSVWGEIGGCGSDINGEVCLSASKKIGRNFKGYKIGCTFTATGCASVKSDRFSQGRRLLDGVVVPSSEVLPASSNADAAVALGHDPEAPLRKLDDASLSDGPDAPLRKLGWRRRRRRRRRRAPTSRGFMFGVSIRVGGGCMGAFGIGGQVKVDVGPCGYRLNQKIEIRVDLYAYINIGWVKFSIGLGWTILSRNLPDC